MSFNAYILGGFVGTLFDEGFANVLGLQTLRHGTNPINYFSIRTAGGDPNHGGKTTGSTYGFVPDKTRNWFYIFKDSELCQSNKKIVQLSVKIISAPFIISLTRMHCFLSTYNFTHISTLKLINIPISIIGGAIGLLITPTLKFRFEKIDAKRLFDDPAYSGFAYRTTKKVEAWRIGFIGTIVTGLNSDWLYRIKADPMKLAVGIIQLVAAVALAKFVIAMIAANACVMVPATVGTILS